MIDIKRWATICFAVIFALVSLLLLVSAYETDNPLKVTSTNGSLWEQFKIKISNIFSSDD